MRYTGCAALDLAYVASGRLDGFFHNKINIWDVAAGALMVSEAGGVVNDIDEMFFAEKNKGAFLNNHRLRVSKKNSLDDCLFSSNHEGVKFSNLNMRYTDLVF